MSYDAQTGLWQVMVPMQPPNTTVKFYITAYDKAGNVAVNDDSGECYTYTVMP
jgi:hypothetical protein